MGKKRPKAEAPAASKPGPPSLPLFAWLCSQMKADDLSQIASLDYMHDVSQHHAALRRLAAGDIRDLAPLEWHPREVLELDHLMERWRGEDEKPHLMLAKLLLRHRAGASPDELAGLIERADKLAGAVREDPCYLWGPVQRAYGWVLDLTNFNQRGRLWKQHLDAMLMDLCAHPEMAIAAERLMALRERKD